MSEKLFQYRGVQARHRNAPLAQEREAYLSHRAEQGSAKGTLLNIARELLVVCRYVHLFPLHEIDAAAIQVAAQRWARQQQRHRRARVQRWSQGRFILRATQWLQFLSLLRQPNENVALFSDLIDDFAAFCSLIGHFIQGTQGESRRGGRKIGGLGRGTGTVGALPGIKG